MTTEELFKKYNINESHNRWESTDSWMSVEIYRIMHGGNLPPPNDMSTGWILHFLDKSKNDAAWWAKNVMSRSDWGSLYLSAKRMIYTLSEQILTEYNQTKSHE
jgi:hypothetical protein